MRNFAGHASSARVVVSEGQANGINSNNFKALPISIGSALVMQFSSEKEVACKTVTVSPCQLLLLTTGSS